MVITEAIKIFGGERGHFRSNEPRSSFRPMFYACRRRRVRCRNSNISAYERAPRKNVSFM